MSILLKGMEMPKYGDTFKVYLDAADNVLLVDTSDSSRFYTLVEVKAPHGRLGDLDELEKLILSVTDDPNCPIYLAAEAEQIIGTMPVVIEAEG